MMIGIHNRIGSYSDGWIRFCEEQHIQYKIVNVYLSDISEQLKDCDAFMWHYNHQSPRDILFAKQLLFSLQQAGKVVFPDFNTGWHFNDKLGQKYLLEACKLPLIPTYAFFSEEAATKWAREYTFPAVLKLRGGAGSCYVRLIKTRAEALKAIRTAFGRGFRQIDPWNDIKDTFRNKFKHKSGFKQLIKSLVHIIYPYQIEKITGREKGYIYFQAFIPDCKFDIRVQLIGEKCYAMTRKVRDNDFRASGGGNIDYDGSKVPIDAIKLTFEVAKRLQVQTLAIDLLPYDSSYLIAEISYAFAVDEGELDFGYWDNCLVWHDGVINPYAWMVEDVVVKAKNTSENI